MNILLAVLMVAVVGTYVAAPFFRRDAEEEEPLPDSPAYADTLERQKREAYAAIKEAQFDHEMGKLSEVDFAALTEKYRRQALAAIAALEQSSTRDEAGAAVRLPSRVAFCASCGTKVPAKANFCPSCGRAIKSDREALRAESNSAVAGAIAQIG